MSMPVMRVITAAIRVRVPMTTTALGPSAAVLPSRQRRRRAVSRTAALPHAVVHTLQQTLIRRRRAGGALAIQPPAIGIALVA